MARPVYRANGMDIQKRNAYGAYSSILTSADVVNCDLSSEDVLKELHLTFNDLSRKLSYVHEGDPDHKEHPFVKFVLRYQEGGPVFQTALLILRGHCYSYSFYAHERWRVVFDSEFDLDGNDGNKFQRESYTSSYMNNDHDEAGLSNLAHAVQSLNANEPHNWQRWYIHLVFVFIESARLSPVAGIMRSLFSRHVDSCIAHCVHGGDLSRLPRTIAIQKMCEVCRERLLILSQAPVHPIDELAYDYRGAWGTLSRA